MCQVLCYVSTHLILSLVKYVLSHPQEDLLKKRMATHSSILAWKVPWTEESGRAAAHGTQRAGHD